MYHSIHVSFMLLYFCCCSWLGAWHIICRSVWTLSSLFVKYISRKNRLASCLKSASWVPVTQSLSFTLVFALENVASFWTTQLMKLLLTDQSCSWEASRSALLRNPAVEWIFFMSIVPKCFRSTRTCPWNASVWACYRFQGGLGFLVLWRSLDLFRVLSIASQRTALCHTVFSVLPAAFPILQLDFDFIF